MINRSLGVYRIFVSARYLANLKNESVFVYSNYPPLNCYHYKFLCQLNTFFFQFKVANSEKLLEQGIEIGFLWSRKT